jgi:hypothetical protein
MKSSSSDSERKMHLKEAAGYLGVSHRKMGQLVKEGLESQIDPLDKRRKLVQVKDLDKLKQASVNRK